MKLTLSNSDHGGRALDPLSNSATNQLARDALIFAAGAMFYWALASLVPYFSGLNIVRLSPFFVAAAGYFLGVHAGTIASLTAVVIHTLVFNRVGIDGPFAVAQMNPAVHVGILLLGPMAGWLRTGNRRLQRDVARGKEKVRDMREAQLRFRQLADTVEDVLWACSADRTRMEYLSPTFEAVFGMPRTRIEDNPRSLLKFVHCNDRKVVTQMFDSSPETVSESEFRIIRPDGAARWIRSRSLCVRDKGSAALRLAGVWADVTDGKNDAAALRASMAQYNDLVEKIPAVVYVAPLDPTQPLLYVSPQIEFVLGYPQDVWLSDAGGFTRSYHPDDADAVTRTLAECVGENKRFVADYRMVTRNGSVRWFHDEADVVHDPSGEPLFVQGVLRDATQKRYSEVLERGRSQVLAKLAAGASMPDVLTTLSESAEELVPDSVCFVALLDREVNRMYCGAFSSLPPQFVRSIDGARPGADAGCVGRVIHTGERAVIADASDCSLQAEHVERMLESGLRGCWVEPIRSSRGETLGALAIYLQRVAEPDRRDLDLLKSAANLAAVAIELRQAQADLRRSEDRWRKRSADEERPRRQAPVLPAREKQTAQGQFPTFQNAFREATPTPPRPGSATALVVGDEAAVQRLIRGVLQKKGYRVLAAGDGPEALAAADRAKIDLLITEVVLARGDGRELADRIRARRAGLKVLLVSGYIGSASVSVAELGPGTSLLSKPFTSDALARKLRVLMDTPPPAPPPSPGDETAPDRPSR